MAYGDKPSCQRCGDTYSLHEGCELTPECDRCAQAALGELRAKVRAYLAKPSIDGQADLAHLCREDL